MPRERAFQSDDPVPRREFIQRQRQTVLIAAPVSAHIAGEGKRQRDLGRSGHFAADDKFQIDRPLIAFHLCGKEGYIGIVADDRRSRQFGSNGQL